VGKGLGENGMNGASEMEMSISRSRGVLKCMIEMKVECSIRGQREERTQLLERNGAKMEIIYCKQMDKQHMFFIFCTTIGWWGNLEALRAAQRGKALILCGYYT
jgi:hypothetical protein